MAKIYRTSDRIPVQIGDIRVVISPLSFKQKSDISDTIVNGSPAAAAMLAIRYSIKAIHGVEEMDGSPYDLEMDQDILSEACADDLMNMEHSVELSSISLALLGGIPEAFLDPETGEPMKGVEIIKKESKGKKQKAVGS